MRDDFRKEAQGFVPAFETSRGEVTAEPTTWEDRFDQQFGFLFHFDGTSGVRYNLLAFIRDLLTQYTEAQPDKTMVISVKIRDGEHLDAIRYLTGLDEVKRSRGDLVTLNLDHVLRKIAAGSPILKALLRPEPKTTQESKGDD